MLAINIIKACFLLKFEFLLMFEKKIHKDCILILIILYIYIYIHIQSREIQIEI